MNVFKIKGLFLVVLTVALAFVIAWPTSCVFGWTYTNIFDGRTSYLKDNWKMNKKHLSICILGLIMTALGVAGMVVVAKIENASSVLAVLSVLSLMIGMLVAMNSGSKV